MQSLEFFIKEILNSCDQNTCCSHGASYSEKMLARALNSTLNSLKLGCTCSAIGGQIRCTNCQIIAFADAEIGR